MPRYTKEDASPKFIGQECCQSMQMPLAVHSLHGMHAIITLHIRSGWTDVCSKMRKLISLPMNQILLLLSVSQSIAMPPFKEARRRLLEFGKQVSLNSLQHCHEFPCHCFRRCWNVACIFTQRAAWAFPLACCNPCHGILALSTIYL